MLDVVKVSVWVHRPPNLPQWRVEYRMNRLERVRFVFAADEMAAWADTLRWWDEIFGHRCDQKT